MIKPPKPKFKVGQIIKKHYEKKAYKIVLAEFNPWGNGNSWYYSFSKDENHMFREDYLESITSPQLQIFPIS